jgi:hypothetical protein
MNPEDGVLFVYEDGQLYAVVYMNNRVIMGDEVYTIPGIYQTMLHALYNLTVT